MLRRDFVLSCCSLIGSLNVARADANDLSHSISSVGTRVGYARFWNTDTAQRWMTTRLAHSMPNAAGDIQLVYGNLGHAKAGFEASGANPIRITCGIEYPEGEVRATTFAGKTSIEIQPGQIVTSDPIQTQIKARSLFFSCTSVAVEVAPYIWPMNRLIRREIGDAVVSGSGAPSNSGGNTQHRAGPVGLGPFNIIGRIWRPGHPSVVVLGDSVAAGHTDSGSDGGCYGYVERGLGNRIPWCNLAVDGEATSSFLRNDEKRMMLIGTGFSHAISAMGIGEVRIGDENKAKELLTELWQTLSARGLKVYQATITTDTRSNDGWTTPGGQTAANSNFLPHGLHACLNAWIRTAPPPLAGYFDPSMKTETAMDSGIWLSPGGKPLTGDGPHLNALGADLASQCLDLARFEH